MIVFSKELEDFWNITSQCFKEMGLKKNTIQTKFYSIRGFVKSTKAIAVSDLEDLNNVRIFVDNCKKTSMKDETIRSHLKDLKVVIDYWISVQEFEDTPYKFTKNVFKYYLFKSNFVNDSESHLPRTELEVYVWIKTMTDPLWQALWILYSQGLRRIEPLRLTADQFDLTKQTLVNIERKSHKNVNKLHKIIYLPNFTIPYLQKLLDLQKNRNSDTLFTSKNPSGLVQRSDTHFKKLMDMKAKLENTERNAYWENIYQGLVLIEKNGKITPHQLRTTWDTLAVKYGCRDVYRRYHLNHRLQGEDEIYVQISRQPEVYNDYTNNIEKNSPTYGL